VGVGLIVGGRRIIRNSGRGGRGGEGGLGFSMGGLSGLRVFGYGVFCVYGIGSEQVFRRSYKKNFWGKRWS